MVNSAPSWLGDAESLTLEYKLAAALKHPGIIVRAAVAFLNTEGGRIVVGVDDQGNVQGVPNVAREKDRIQSILVDRIVPRPLEQIEVRDVRVSTDNHVLEILIKKKRRLGLYAEKDQGMLGFWWRAGATVRPLTFDEVVQRLRSSKKRAWAQNPVRWDAGLEGEQGTVLILQAQWTIDPTKDRKTLFKAAALSALSAHRRSWINGARSTGWSVVGNRSAEATQGKRIEVGRREARKWLLAEPERFVVRFRGAQDFLQWKKPAFVEEPVIYPYAVTEGPATFCRLLGEIAKSPDFEEFLDEEVRCELGLWRPDGWRLGPSRPDSDEWLFADDIENWAPPYSLGSNPEEVHETTWRALRDGPDLESYALVHGLYELFGYDESHGWRVPFWSEVERRFVFGGD